MKLLIYNDSNLPDNEALYYVQQVIIQGRLSGDSYCYCTKFKNGIVVLADKIKASDKFIVTGQIDG